MKPAPAASGFSDAPVYDPPQRVHWRDDCAAFAPVPRQRGQGTIIPAELRTEASDAPPSAAAHARPKVGSLAKRQHTPVWLLARFLCRVRLSLDLRTAAERALKHLAQRFQRTAAEVTRVELQHMSAGTDVLYLGLAFVLPECYRILFFALGADNEGCHFLSLANLSHS